jgi:molybdenum cofactor cytidylyltransferase
MSNNLPRIGAIVLAAGASRRMGRNKALLPIDGVPMIARVVAQMRPACVDPIIVVTGHESAAIARAVSNVEMVHNSNHERGEMLSSIKTGVEAIRSRVEAFFLALGDQPFINPSTLQQLIEAWRALQADVVRPTYRGKHGHPILVHARCAAAILALRDADQTLNDFVRANSTIAVDVPVDDSATIQDLDTPADYDAAIKRRNSAN